VGKFIIGVLLTFTFIHDSFGQMQSPDRGVVIRTMRKSFTLLPLKRIIKSQQQMMAEAQQGRQMFANVFNNPQGMARKRDLLLFSTPIKDQGERGTCVAFATMGQLELMLNRPLREYAPDFSEQYAYWMSKQLANVGPYEEGSIPFKMIKAVTLYGVPAEQAWPYQRVPWYSDPNHPECNQLDPSMGMPTDCITGGQASPAARAMGRVKFENPRELGTSPEHIVGALSMGIPVQVGLMIYAQAWGMPMMGGAMPSAHFYQGRVLMPDLAVDMPIGGHAVLIVGYDLDTKEYIFKNSWGTNDWASQPTVFLTLPNGMTIPKPGYGRIPMEYIRKFAEAAIAFPEGRTAEFR
jgi:hypothetical protein